MTIADAVDATRRVVAAEPQRAVFHLRAEARLEEGTETDVQLGRHTLTVDEPKALGGTGAGPNPLQLVLGSLASCQAITYRYWAEILGIRLDSITVDAEADVDIRGMFALEDGVAPGLSSVRCSVTLGGPEHRDRYEELSRVVDEHCPLLDIFTRPLPVERRVEIA